MFFCERLIDKPWRFNEPILLGFDLKNYFVRIGVLAEIRVAAALAPIDRGKRVVIRSPRGIEVGQIVSEQRLAQTDPSPNRYKIIRPTTHADEQLLDRLDRYKRDALESCRARIKASGSDAILMDVDQLLDGGTLLMHFLGDADEVAKTIAQEIADEYESVVRTDHLSQLLSDGCGPECGTTAGCGSSCAGCSGCGS